MRDPSPLRDEINEKVRELFEFNQKVTEVLRTQAKDFETIGSFFSQQSNRAYEVAALIVEMAAIAAENTGDILVAEFGVHHIDADDDIEEDDDNG